MTLLYRNVKMLVPPIPACTLLLCDDTTWRLCLGHREQPTLKSAEVLTWTFNLWNHAKYISVPVNGLVSGGLLWHLKRPETIPNMDYGVLKAVGAVVCGNLLLDHSQEK